MHKQQGATLVVSLVILLLLTMIAVLSTKSSISQQKMSSNMQDMALGFESSEVALREGEGWVQAQTSMPQLITGTCSSAPCVIATDPTLYLEDQAGSWWDSNGYTITGATLSHVQAQPRYYLQYINYVPDSLVIGSSGVTGKYYFYVTAHGNGATTEVQSVLQSTFAKRY